MNYGRTGIDREREELQASVMQAGEAFMRAFSAIMGAESR